MSSRFNTETNWAKSAVFTARPIRSLLSQQGETTCQFLVFDWLIRKMLLFGAKENWA